MTVVVATSRTLHLQPLLLLLLVATGGAATFSITNRCSDTVWPAALPVGGGKQLNPGQTWALDVPAGTSSGRIWARTGCSFSGGKGACQTGDCGGTLSCSESGQPPATLAEFTLGGSTDYFDIAIVDGFNLPLDFLPARGRPGCSKGPRCAANITSKCPSELKTPGGCKGPCAGANTCARNYSLVFFEMCPDAYIYPNDKKIFACPSGTNYQVVFCPPIDLAPLPASPQPAPTIEITPMSPSPLSVPFGPTSMRSSTGSRLVVILAPVGGFILLMLLIIILFVSKRRTRHREMEEEDAFGELQGTPMRFTFQQLKVATEQFRDKLGEGGFGSVFEGRFGDERIAVKRLDRTGHGKKEFLAEVQTIGSIHHINLVRLIGFCAEKSHRLLVYEYMAKGSLDRWIYYRHDSNAAPLDWRTRYKIITHIAKGLSYLHEECTKRIAHLDVKPQNILLDDNFNAKLSDFGLCKLIDRDKSQVITRMRGTPGYLAPEWLTSQITEKADVYSFGVVVMEIISGRKNLDTSRSEENIHLITMNVETNIDHNFVATSPASFGIAGNVGSSAPALASDLSGPR